MRRALEMQEELSPFNAESRAEGLPHLRMGVGVHVGEVVVGNIGSETRAKYGIVGSAVNVIDRVQESTRGADAVVSESVHHCLGKALLVDAAFEAQLKGFQEKVTLYLVRGVD
jgi:class 3 adenylate cyclase